MSITNLLFDTILIMESRPAFARFVEKKFLEWMLKEGGIRTQAQFAAHLGISQSGLNNYMNGKVEKPDIEVVIKLADEDKLGPEIYEVLGMERPERGVSELQEAYESVPEESREEFLEMIEKYLLANGWKRIK